MSKKQTDTGNKTNQWLGELAKPLLDRLNAETCIPKSRLVFCGLTLFESADPATRKRVLAACSQSASERRAALRGAK